MKVIQSQMESLREEFPALTTSNPDIEQRDIMLLSEDDVEPMPEIFKISRVK